MEEVMNQLHADTLKVLADYINNHGYAPSVKELAGLLGLSSTATVHDRLKVLEADGFITRMGPRAIRIN